MKNYNYPKFQDKSTFQDKSITFQNKSTTFQDKNINFQDKNIDKLNITPLQQTIYYPIVNNPFANLNKNIITEKNNNLQKLKNLLNSGDQAIGQIINLFNNSNEDNNQYSPLKKTNKFSINFKDDEGNSPIHLIINLDYYIMNEENRLFLIDYLILLGADVNIKNNLLQTPLLLAVIKLYKTIVELLIKKEAYNSNDITGQNVFHYLLINNRYQLKEDIFNIDNSNNINALQLEQNYYTKYYNIFSKNIKVGEQEIKHLDTLINNIDISFYDDKNIISILSGDIVDNTNFVDTRIKSFLNKYKNIFIKNKIDFNKIFDNNNNDNVFDSISDSIKYENNITSIKFEDILDFKNQINENLENLKNDFKQENQTNEELKNCLDEIFEKTYIYKEIIKDNVEKKNVYNINYDVVNNFDYDEKICFFYYKLLNKIIIEKQVDNYLIIDNFCILMLKIIKKFKNNFNKLFKIINYINYDINYTFNYVNNYNIINEIKNNMIDEKLTDDKLFNYIYKNTDYFLYLFNTRLNKNLDKNTFNKIYNYDIKNLNDDHNFDNYNIKNNIIRKNNNDNDKLNIFNIIKKISNNMHNKSDIINIELDLRKILTLEKMFEKGKKIILNNKPVINYDNIIKREEQYNNNNDKYFAYYDMFLSKYITNTIQDINANFENEYKSNKYIYKYDDKILDENNLFKNININDNYKKNFNNGYLYALGIQFINYIIDRKKDKKYMQSLKSLEKNIDYTNLYFKDILYNIIYTYQESKSKPQLIFKNLDKNYFIYGILFQLGLKYDDDDVDIDIKFHFYLIYDMIINLTSNNNNYIYFLKGLYQHTFTKKIIIDDKNNYINKKSIIQLIHIEFINKIDIINNNDDKIKIIYNNFNNDKFRIIIKNYNQYLNKNIQQNYIQEIYNNYIYDFEKYIEDNFEKDFDYYKELKKIFKNLLLINKNFYNNKLLEFKKEEEKKEEEEKEEEEKEEEEEENYNPIDYHILYNYLQNNNIQNIFNKYIFINKINSINKLLYLQNNNNENINKLYWIIDNKYFGFNELDLIYMDDIQFFINDENSQYYWDDYKEKYEIVEDKEEKIKEKKIDIKKQKIEIMLNMIQDDNYNLIDKIKYDIIEYIFNILFYNDNDIELINLRINLNSDYKFINYNNNNEKEKINLKLSIINFVKSINNFINDYSILQLNNLIIDKINKIFNYKINKSIPIDINNIQEKIKDNNFKYNKNIITKLEDNEKYIYFDNNYFEIYDIYKMKYYDKTKIDIFDILINKFTLNSNKDIIEIILNSENILDFKIKYINYMTKDNINKKIFKKIIDQNKYLLDEFKNKLLFNKNYINNNTLANIYKNYFKITMKLNRLDIQDLDLDDIYNNLKININNINKNYYKKIINEQDYNLNQLFEAQEGGKNNKNNLNLINNLYQDEKIFNSKIDNLIKFEKLTIFKIFNNISSILLTKTVNFIYNKLNKIINKIDTQNIIKYEEISIQKIIPIKLDISIFIIESILIILKNKILNSQIEKIYNYSDLIELIYYIIYSDNKNEFKNEDKNNEDKNKLEIKSKLKYELDKINKINLIDKIINNFKNNLLLNFDNNSNLSEIFESDIKNYLRNFYVNLIENLYTYYINEIKLINNINQNNKLLNEINKKLL